MALFVVSLFFFLLISFQIRFLANFTRFLYRTHGHRFKAESTDGADHWTINVNHVWQWESARINWHIRLCGKVLLKFYYCFLILLIKISFWLFFYVSSQIFTQIILIVHILKSFRCFYFLFRIQLNSLRRKILVQN